MIIRSELIIRNASVDFIQRLKIVFSFNGIGYLNILCNVRPRIRSAAIPVVANGIMILFSIFNL